MKKIIALVIVGISFSWVQAQTHLPVKVLHAETKESLEGVTIALNGQAIRITDKNGKAFRMEFYEIF